MSSTSGGNLVEESTAQKSGAKRDWALTQGAFQRLLDWFDEESDSGGERYLEIRRRLVVYFDRKNCLSPDELADETLNRVARRLEEEGAIVTDAPTHYCYIVARFVLLEAFREQQRQERLESNSAVGPIADFAAAPDPSESEQSYACARSASQKKLWSRSTRRLLLCSTVLPIFTAQEASTRAPSLLYGRALSIKEKTLGPDHPYVVYTLSKLALLYRTTGDFVRAEPLYGRALTVSENALGEDHDEVARSLDALASFYREKRDSAKAEPLYERALTVLEKTRGTDHPSFAVTLNNLANLYRDKGDYERAEPLYQRALSIKERVLGPDHPDVGRYRDNLALLYYARGDYAKAEPLYMSALETWEKTLGPNHPMVGRSLSNLANLYLALNDYAKAALLYKRALSIYETALGPNYYFVASILTGLAKASSAEGKLAQAVAYQARANAIIEHNLDLNLATGSERQKLAYLDSLPEQLNQAISLHVRFGADDRLARELAVTTVLQRKGRVLDALSNNLAALRGRSSAEDQALLDQLNDITAQLAQLVLNGPQDNTPAEHQKRIRALEEQREKLESEISHRSAEFYAQSQPVTLAAIRSAIPDNAALIELAVYRPFDPKANGAQAYGEPHYVAYVVRNQSDVRSKELGEAKAIDMAIDQWRQALCDPRRNDVKQLGRAVDQKVMQPLRALVGDATHLLVSPDGELNLIPFEGLVDEQGRHLVERYSISYLTSGRDLLRLQVARASKSPPVVLANPMFGEPDLLAIASATGPKSRPARSARLPQRRFNRQSVTTGPDLENVYFAPLYGTAQEAQSIKSLFAEASLLTGTQATESALKRASAPRLLHIATHGFFLTDTPTTSSNATGDNTRAINAYSRIANPLLRSGLALAGANLHRGNDEDGILTALEASGLNLWGTKLVTLSACNTGLGEVKNGEGVYGLRRSFVLAGAETLVMSLWPVSDYVTREL